MTCIFLDQAEQRHKVGRIKGSMCSQNVDIESDPSEPGCYMGPGVSGKREQS